MESEQAQTEPTKQPDLFWEKVTKILWLVLQSAALVTFVFGYLLPGLNNYNSTQKVIALSIVALVIITFLLWFFQRNTPLTKLRAVYKFFRVVTSMLVGLTAAVALLGWIITTSTQLDNQRAAEECRAQGGVMKFGGCGFGGCVETCQFPGQPSNCTGLGCEEHYYPLGNPMHDR